uniref:Ras-specific guanine nucleotide-releasing factor 2 n=1 Tax=Macrostomum lignano TaxID=282301 RepID=A0A1I8HJ56_9PLAT
KTIRVNDSQLLHLASKARRNNAAASTMAGNLFKRSLDTGRWQLRYFILYQNLLFYYETERNDRPSGVALLEGSYCDKFASVKLPDRTDRQQLSHCFSIFYKKDGQRHYDLRAESETDCEAWVEAIRNARFVAQILFAFVTYSMGRDARDSRLQELKEELDQKHQHLMHILESERRSKWNYVQQTEELGSEVRKLRMEIRELKGAKRIGSQLGRSQSSQSSVEESEELRRSKKASQVQSFFRGWLCRRRWKQIVEMYIKSEHAEHMRKRNGIVFGLVECEQEYVQQISVLVSCFLRPFKMAASARKPIISHEDVNSIFLNAETLLFLHQIFLQGLNSKMDNWPTLQLGDLFDMLLPMLAIYQEYVRNHHFSLQVLAEYKQKPEFAALLKRYEDRPVCEGRSLDTFLTYPMHQIPRYIITLHELLAHTPHDHVDRQQLEFANSKLENLSHVMHDEVSETENIRKNLAIERTIVEGCDILLDVNQIFVRQGTLTQVMGPDKQRIRPRLGSFSSTFGKDSKKEAARQVFLFTNHLILTTRASNGRLHLVKNNGKIPLADCTLSEDTSSDFFYCEDDYNTGYDSQPQSQQQQQQSQQNSGMLTVGTPPKSQQLQQQQQQQHQQQQQQQQQQPDYGGLDFRLIMDVKSGPPVIITLVAISFRRKRLGVPTSTSDLLNSSLAEISSVSMPHTIRSDPKLYRDDIDIKFSRTLNSCKVPQIRHASVDRLLDRLTDLRFLSIDFLNTFLLTYRIFTKSETVINALRQVLSNPECGNLDPRPSFSAAGSGEAETSGNFLSVYGGVAAALAATRGASGGSGGTGGANYLHVNPLSDKTRRISTGMMRMEAASGTDGSSSSHRTGSLDATVAAALSPTSKGPTEKPNAGAPKSPQLLPSAASSQLTDVLHELSDSIVDKFCLHSNGSNLAVDSLNSSCSEDEKEIQPNRDPAPPQQQQQQQQQQQPPAQRQYNRRPNRPSHLPAAVAAATSATAVATSAATSTSRSALAVDSSGSTSPRRATSPTVSTAVSPIAHSASSPTVAPLLTAATETTAKNVTFLSPGGVSSGFLSPRGSMASSNSSKRPSYAESSGCDLPAPASAAAVGPPPCKAGAVVTSSRAVGRRSSNTAAALAFAVATAGAASTSTVVTSTTTVTTARRSTGTAPSQPQQRPSDAAMAAAAFNSNSMLMKRLSIICTAATMRVLNVLRHWVYKFGEDVEADIELRQQMIQLLEDLVVNQFFWATATLLVADLSKSRDINLIKNVCDFVKPRVQQITKLLCKCCFCYATGNLIDNPVNIDSILTPSGASSDALGATGGGGAVGSSKTGSCFDRLSALDIAEQMTYIDHQLFRAMKSTDIIMQISMRKSAKDKTNSTVLRISRRFNEMSSLVITEIVSRTDVTDRIACIEKWAAIADICRCLRNYNGVLQICAAFVNSAVFRLKRTWDRLSKTTRLMVDRLQQLVSSDGRFRNMRAALHTCDPPCIPYLGMYLTDLSFIEEGTSNITEEGLVNFCKMRMVANFEKLIILHLEIIPNIAHVIREIQQYQQTPYRIEYNAT